MQNKNKNCSGIGNNSAPDLTSINGIIKYLDGFKIIWKENAPSKKLSRTWWDDNSHIEQYNIINEYMRKMLDSVLTISEKLISTDFSEKDIIISQLWNSYLNLYKIFSKYSSAILYEIFLLGQVICDEIIKVVNLLLAKNAKFNFEEAIIRSSNKDFIILCLNNGANVNLKSKSFVYEEKICSLMSFWHYEFVMADMYLPEINRLRKKEKYIKGSSVYKEWELERCRNFLQERLDEFHIKLEILLKSGVNPNTKFASGETFLFWDLPDAAVRLLLSFGADINHTRDDGKTPIMIQTFDVDILRQSHVDVHIADKDGRTALFYSTNIETTKYLLDSGADVNAADKDGRTPLFFIEDFEILKLLVDRGADLKILDNEGKSPIHCIPYMTEDTLKYLLAQGLDINTVDTYGRTLIYNNDLIGIYINFFVKNNGNINHVDNDGRTALFYATDVFFAQDLIENGIDVSKLDNKGISALDHFSSMNDSDSKKIVNAIKIALRKKKLS